MGNSHKQNHKFTTFSLNSRPEHLEVRAAFRKSQNTGNLLILMVSDFYRMVIESFFVQKMSFIMFSRKICKIGFDLYSIELKIHQKASISSDLIVSMNIQ